MHVDTDVDAGTVINSENFWAKAKDYRNGNEEFTTFKEDKSLVTYASDLNLDGRVSMVDLAYLNSGAGEGATYARDVDVNFDGEISINDLQAMDDQFGSSLHTTNLIDRGLGQFDFTGYGGTISLYEDDSIYSEQADDSFIDQNILENGADAADYLDGTALLTDSFSGIFNDDTFHENCLLYTSPSPRDKSSSRMPSSA